MTTPFPFVAGAVLTAAELNAITTLPINDQTDDYTLVVGDVGKRVVMNKSNSEHGHGRRLDLRSGRHRRSPQQRRGRDNTHRRGRRNTQRTLPSATPVPVRFGSIPLSIISPRIPVRWISENHKSRSLRSLRHVYAAGRRDVRYRAYSRRRRRSRFKRQAQAAQVGGVCRWHD
jgi:hypothetical protein